MTDNYGLNTYGEIGLAPGTEPFRQPTDVHAPDTDPASAGMSSMTLLAEVLRQGGEKGLRVGNVDVTVLAQRPKLRDYIPAMLHSLAGAMDVPLDRVNIKATTEEGLGFTGREEAIACHAVCLLEEL